MKKIIIFGLFCLSLMILGCGDSGNSGKTADNGNDSGREMGSLYGECYPNETCDKGLECDVDNNICVKETEKSGDTENADTISEDAENKPNTDSENFDDDSDSTSDSMLDDETDSSDSMNDSGDSTNDKDTGTSDSSDSTPDADTSDTGDSSNNCTPSGTCATIDGNTWSSLAPEKMKWSEGITYCYNLSECGFKDWKMPNIDELRTLIQGCSGSITGGTCPISEKAGKLAGRDRTSDCNGRDGSNFSKLGDTDWFWSSSVHSDNSNLAWYVDFDDGHVNYSYKSNYSYVRCVR